MDVITGVLTQEHLLEKISKPPEKTCHVVGIEVEESRRFGRRQFNTSKLKPVHDMTSPTATESPNEFPGDRVIQSHELSPVNGVALPFFQKKFLPEFLLIQLFGLENRLLVHADHVSLRHDTDGAAGELEVEVAPR